MSSFLFLWEGSRKLFCPIWPETVVLPISTSLVGWNVKCKLPYLTIDWDGGPVNLLLGLASNCNPSLLSLPSS
jgi:hypothetical protein